jgi:hypothetical protein
MMEGVTVLSAAAVASAGGMGETGDERQGISQIVRPTNAAFF